MEKGLRVERFGRGFDTRWDPDLGNLTISPLYEPTRRLRMYIKVLPHGNDTMVEMFAVVEQIQDDFSTGTLWSDPVPDLVLEKELYEAFLLELMDRRGGGSG